MKKSTSARIDRDHFRPLAEKLVRMAYDCSEKALEEYGDATLGDAFGIGSILSHHTSSPSKRGQRLSVEVILVEGEQDGHLVARAELRKRAGGELIRLYWWAGFPAEDLAKPESGHSVAQSLFHAVSPGLSADCTPRPAPHESKALSAELADEVTRRMLSEDGKPRRGESPEDVLRRVLESVMADPRVLALTDANRRRLRRDLYQDANEKGFV